MHLDLERIAAIQRSIIGAVLLAAIVVATYRSLAWTARRIHLLQAWWAAWNARVAERDIAPTAQALQQLGLGDLSIQSLRAAGQKTAASVKLRYQLLTFVAAFGAGDLVIAVIKTIDTQKVQPDLKPSALMLAAVTLPLLVWAAQRGKAIVGYRFLLSIMAAIEACEAVASADTSDRHQALRHLDDTCCIVRRSLLRVHRISNSVRRGSPRQHNTKRHVALVVAKLQLAEAQVDAKGDGGLRSLAALLAKVGNSYAAGNASRLLPEQSLRGTTPVVNREGLRLMTVVAVSVGTMCFAVLAGVPAGIETVLAAGAAVSAATMVYGPRVAIAKAAEIMGILKQ